MNTSIWLTKEVQAYISNHHQEDISKIILKGSPFSTIPITWLAQQMEGKKKAQHKLPFLYDIPTILYPPKLNLEQCSSQKTAEFKASIVQKGDTMIDCTGGYGIDTYFLSHQFKKAIYCEQYADLAALVAYNMKELDANHIETVPADGISYINSLKTTVDLIYIDPARRDDSNKKQVLFSTCTPDITTHLDLLVAKAKQVLIKASPMLDISQAITQLKAIKTIYIVAVHNECKELLFLLDKENTAPCQLSCINLDKKTQLFNFTLDEEKQHTISLSTPLSYLYDPNKAISKAGGYKSIAHRFELKKLHVNTHLYTSASHIADFPGQIYAIENQCSYDKKQVQEMIQGNGAIIHIKNFPDDMQQIKKKLHITDKSESIHLFFTRGLNDKPLVLKLRLLS